MYMESISHHIMPLIINSLGGGYIHIHITDKINFLETKCTLGCGWHAPGLKTGRLFKGRGRDMHIFFYKVDNFIYCMINYIFAV